MNFFASLLVTALLTWVSTGLGQQHFDKEHVERESTRIAHAILKDIEGGKLPARVDEALHTLVKMAAWHLKDQGRSELAMRYEYEFNEQFLGYISRVYDRHDIPDKYEPLSDWLRDFYNTLEFIFGEPFMRATRLFDIKVINNCIPVTFCLFDIELALKNHEEYFPYFEALVGTVTYWVANGVCIGVTWGAGTFWLCTPIAWGAENVMEKFLAPRISEPSYNLFCK